MKKEGTLQPVSYFNFAVLSKNVLSKNKDSLAFSSSSSSSSLKTRKPTLSSSFFIFNFASSSSVIPTGFRLSLSIFCQV